VTLDDALDELYGAPLEEFVAERKRLAKKLGGDDGKEVAALRKPSLAAWALNQLARRERRDIDLLLDAGHRMRQAGIDKDAFEQARAKEADAVRKLTRAAERLGVRGPAVQKVNAALRAAAVTEGGRELLARGRFVELPEASGFEAYEGLELPKAPKRKPKAKTATKPRVSDEEKEARAALREAEQNLRRATAEVEAARRRLDRLQGG
jgi:hypothetical protein